MAKILFSWKKYSYFLANVDVFVRRVLRVRKFKRTRIISRWPSRIQTTWTTWKPRSWQKYLMASQRTVKFLRSLSLKWCLPTFPFQGEITLVDSKKIPTFQGRVTGFGKNVQPYDNIRAEKVSFYFQIILWSWGFVTLCPDRVTSRPAQKKNLI